MYKNYISKSQWYDQGFEDTEIENCTDCEKGRCACFSFIDKCLEEPGAYWVSSEHLKYSDPEKDEELKLTLVEM